MWLGKVIKFRWVCSPLVKGHWLPKALGIRYSASTMKLLHAPLASSTEASQSAFPERMIYSIRWIRLREAKSCLQPPSKFVPEVGLETQTSLPGCGHWKVSSKELQRTVKAMRQAFLHRNWERQRRWGRRWNGALQIRQHSWKTTEITSVLPEVCQWHFLCK